MDLRSKAVIEGTRQVLPGVMSSFLTTVAVFAPLSFLSGELGAVLEVLPVVLIAALAASLVEAFLILPHHLKGSVARLHQAHDSRFRVAGLARPDHPIFTCRGEAAGWRQAGCPH